MKRLVLVRHGESQWNAQRRVQGQSCAGLSERGRAQAKVLASHIATRFGRIELVSSDLQRAAETAAVITDVLGVDVTFDVALRERSFGKWEGRLVDDVAADEPERWRRWRSGEDVIAEVDGESSDALSARVVPAIAKHLDATDDGHVTVVVAHGGTIWHGIHGMFDLARPTLGGVANVAMTTIGASGEHRWLEAWNVDAFVPETLRGTEHVQRQTRMKATPPPVGM